MFSTFSTFALLNDVYYNIIAGCRSNLYAYMDACGDFHDPRFHHNSYFCFYCFCNCLNFDIRGDPPSITSAWISSGKNTVNIVNHDC